MIISLRRFIKSRSIREVILGLTPEYLNSDNNIVTAHKKTCNKKSELGLLECFDTLRSEGVDALPTIERVNQTLAKH